MLKNIFEAQNNSRVLNKIQNGKPVFDIEFPVSCLFAMIQRQRVAYRTKANR
jgi:hypothetical protein